MAMREALRAWIEAMPGFSCRLAMQARRAKANTTGLITCELVRDAADWHVRAEAADR